MGGALWGASCGILLTGGVACATCCEDGGGTIADGGIDTGGGVTGGGGGAAEDDPPRVIAATIETSGSLTVGVPSVGVRTGVASSPLSSAYSTCSIGGPDWVMLGAEGRMDGGGGAELRGGTGSEGGGAEALWGAGGTGLVNVWTPLEEGIIGRA